MKENSMIKMKMTKKHSSYRQVFSKEMRERRKKPQSQKYSTLSLESMDYSVTKALLIMHRQMLTKARPW